MANREHVVITSIGTDRPGIVEELAGWLLEHGGNIEDSRMTILGGEFATMILVSGDSSLQDKLSSDKERFETNHKLTLFLKAVSGQSAPAADPSLRYTLRATSLDHPGIVHQVAALLRSNEINIVSAITQTTPAPFTQAPVFQILMQVDIPARVGMGKLRDELRALGDRENIDFTLTSADGTIGV